MSKSPVRKLKNWWVGPNLDGLRSPSLWLWLLFLLPRPSLVSPSEQTLWIPLCALIVLLIDVDLLGLLQFTCGEGNRSRLLQMRNRPRKFKDSKLPWRAPWSSAPLRDKDASGLRRFVLFLVLLIFKDVFFFFFLMLRNHCQWMLIRLWDSTPLELYGYIVTIQI